jgi:transposase
MKTPENFIGIDVASLSFTAAVGKSPWQLVIQPTEFANDYDSFPKFLHWLQQHNLYSDNAVLCMEATGVYGEALAYFVHANGYRIAVEPPLKVKRTFNTSGHKSDAVDSRQIAEYAFRYFDELAFWQPKADILEQIKVLLNTREQFSAQLTAHRNALKTLQRKVVVTPLAEQLHQDNITQLKNHIKSIEEEIRRLIDQDPTYRQMASLLMSIPGVGLLLAAQMLVIMENAPQPVSAKSLAAYIGICPYEHLSGTSVFKRSSSRHYGPAAVRKLLYLAAMSLRTHHAQFRDYFLRKVAEGKSKKLVLNNIANKLLKIMCAVLRTRTPYIPNYRSVNPMLLKST